MNNGDQVGDPLVKILRISPYNSWDELSVILIDLELGNNRKNSENTKMSHKNRKVNISYGIIGIINDDYNMLLDRMEEVVNQSCRNINEFPTKLESNVIDLL